LILQKTFKKFSNLDLISLQSHKISVGQIVI
jgi:hypothetical protein